MDPKVIHEDNDILVVNKPYGMVVNRSESVKTTTLQDWIEENYNFVKGSNVFGQRSGVVHRLDKETSGVLVIAKNQDAFSNLQGQFAKRQVNKKYLVLVHGEIKDAHGAIDVGIARNPRNRHRFVPSLFEGKQARTEYEVEGYYKSLQNEVLTYLLASPFTGRTHQIRVHFKFIKHPIVSDLIYGGRKTLRKDLTWCSRLFLHAANLAFFHPTTGKKVEFSASLPIVLEKALNGLKRVD